MIIWLIGLMSGFTLMLSGNTLNFWLALVEIDIRTIGIFALVSLPYAVNFLWAPLFDIYKLPYLHKLLGQRISWIIVLQILLSTAVYMLSSVSPTSKILTFAIFALIISFLASAIDTVLGALRTEIVSKERQGEVSGTYIFGYRIGMLISGYGAIYMSSFVSFDFIYELFSLIILLFPVLLFIQVPILRKATIIAKNSESDFFSSSNQSGILERIKSLLKNILYPVGTSFYIGLVIIFLIIYRLPDNFIMMMVNPFLLKIGYSTTEIAHAGKLFGVISAIIGGLLASRLMKNRDIFTSLILFGSIHAASHIMYLVQEIQGYNIYLLFTLVGFEGITGGMTMAAYIGFIAALCNGKFRATQYSFFSSMMGLSRSILPAASGYLVALSDWKMFFTFAIVASIPPIVLIWYIKTLGKNNKGA